MNERKTRRKKEIERSRMSVCVSERERDVLPDFG